MSISNQPSVTNTGIATSNNSKEPEEARAYSYLQTENAQVGEAVEVFNLVDFVLAQVETGQSGE